MELQDMYTIIKAGRNAFENVLKIENEDERNFEIVSLIRSMTFICGSDFEEQCIIENFREVLNNHYSERRSA